MGSTRLSGFIYRITFFVVCSFAILPANADNLILNGSFETPEVNPLSQCGPYADCAGYHNATAGNDFIGAWLLLPNAPIPSGWAAVMVTGYNYQETNNATGAPLYFHPENGGQALDLTGEGNQGTNNGVKQTIATVSGKPYDLSFYLGHQYSDAPGYTNGPAALNLYVDGQWSGLFTNGQNTVDDVNWEFFSYDFTAASTSTTIAFQNATAYGNNYAGLDNVSVTSVPEPVSLILLGSGLAGLVLHHRKRN